MAIVVALPISYLITHDWLDHFAFGIDLKWWYLAGAGGMALVIAWLTISVQILKAASVQPIECIRDE